MSEEDFQELLTAILYGEYESDEMDEHIDSVRTFEECMLLTRNRGLVIKTPDGSEFHLTIVKSK